MKIRIGTIYRIELINYLEQTEFKGPVLDVGCHDNSNLNFVTAPLKIGIDMEREGKIEGINFVQADARFLPFRNDAFDQIFMMDVIEHIDDETGLSKALARVLKPSGEILLSTPSKKIQLNPWFLTKYISKKWGHFYRLGYTDIELKQLFTDDFEITIKEWDAKWWRFFYLLLRFAVEIYPKLGEFLIRKIFALDTKATQGLHGYLILKGKKIHES